MSSRASTPDSPDSPWRTVPDSPEFRNRKGSKENQSLKSNDSEKSTMSEAMVVAFRRIWGSRKEINASGKDSDNEAPSYVVSTHGKEVQLTPKSSAKAVRSHTTPGTDHTTTTTNNHMNKANRVLGKDLDDSLGQDKDLAKAEAVRNHDLFNLYFVGLIVLLDYYILYHSTEWSKLGTTELGVDYRPLSQVLLGLLTLYLVVDTIWIVIQPSCVLAGVPALVAHHTATLLFALVPYLEPRYHWHLTVTLAVEVNTFFLVARRNVPLNSTFYHFFNAAFYASWLFFRLLVFPALVLLYWFEYIEFRYDPLGGNGAVINIVLLAPLLMGMLTLLGFKWTYDMLWKMIFKKEKKN